MDTVGQLNERYTVERIVSARGRGPIYLARDYAQPSRRPQGPQTEFGVLLGGMP
ncbi:MAG: hypothetical protein ABI039_14105 [Vicinamibacterales bacterium]